MNRRRIVKESEAVVPEGFIPMYCTPTCWRSNCGFFGLTARRITSTIASTSSARNDNRRNKQQQHPFNDADDDERDGVLG